MSVRATFASSGNLRRFDVNRRFSVKADIADTQHVIALDYRESAKGERSGLLKSAMVMLLFVASGFAPMQRLTVLWVSVF